MQTKLKESEVAEILQVSIGTLRRMRQDANGPPWHNLRKNCGEKALIRYDHEELNDWLKTTKQTSKD